jgi:hypothetical protein
MACKMNAMERRVHSANRRLTNLKCMTKTPKVAHITATAVVLEKRLAGHLGQFDLRLSSSEQCGTAELYLNSFGTLTLWLSLAVWPVEETANRQLQYR